MKFYFNCYLPCLNKNIKIYEIKNDNVLSLIKFITNDFTDDIIDAFEEILKSSLKDEEIYQDLNIIDKFFILLSLRANCISNEIEFNTGAIKTRVILTILLNDLSKKIKNIDKKIAVIEDEMYIKLGLPKKLYIKDIDDAFLSVIDQIILPNEVITFQDLSYKEQQEIIEKLPGSFTKQIFNFIEETNNYFKSIYLFRKKETQISLGLYDNTIFELLKIIFKDNLYDFYEMQYSLTTKVNISYDHFCNQTPNESKLYVTLHNEHIKQQEELINKKKH